MSEAGGVTAIEPEPAPAPARPRVWAPRATRVDIVTATGSWPMAPDPVPDLPTSVEVGRGAGWFEAPAGWEAADYRYRLDGDDLLVPDPRSRWQPAGVHGPTRPFDPAAFAWTDVAFTPTRLPDAVIYEVHVGTFSRAGTFLGAIDHLDHLVDLGVTHVELMPVNAYAGRWGWGYDGVDLFAVHPAYGDPADLQHLVDACHARDLAVLLDVVYNHLGPEGNYLELFGPYFTDRYHTPWGPGVNLDGPDSDEVRAFFIDNACAWLRDFHVDGLRLDAMHAVVDSSARHWLEELTETVAALDQTTGRTSTLIAEHDGNDPRLVGRRADHGFGLDAVWNDDVHHALHSAITGERDGYYADYDGLDDVERAWRRGWVYDGRYAVTRRRRHGRPFTGRDGDALVVGLQNHDQIGNRARGERIDALSSVARQGVGAALVLLSPFVPLLFQGEDWAATSPFPYFSDHDDPELAEAIRAGRRAEFTAFGWAPEDVLDPEDEATYRRAHVSWSDLADGADPVHRELLEWYRLLVTLRRNHPELRAAPLERVRVHRPAPDSLVVRRRSFVLATNLGPASLLLGPDDLVPPGTGALNPTAVPLTVVATWGKAAWTGDLELAPDSAVVLRHQAIAPPPTDRPARDGSDAS